MDNEKLIVKELKEIKRALTCESTPSVVSDPCCPATNLLLNDIKSAIDNLDISVDNLVLNTDTLEINTDEVETLLTDIKVDLEKVIDTFQILDCGGLPIGAPQDILKTIVLNKLTTQICNAQELADLIAEAIVFPVTPTLVNYNKEEELIITPDTIYSILSNTVHGYGLSVIGTGTTSTITINGGTAVPISNGYSKQVEFSTTNDFTIDIFCDVNDVIRLIKQY